MDGQDLQSKLIKIVITIDTFCAWCYIGHKRLAKAIAVANQRTPGLRFDITYSPFFLMPHLTSESQPFKQILATKFGSDKVENMLNYLKTLGESDGIKFDFTGMAGSTFDCHRLLAHAQSKQNGTHHKVLAEFYRTFFEQRRSLSEFDVLLDCGMKGGMERDEVERVLRSDEYADYVRDKVQEAKDNKIMGVPYFNINDGAYKLSGAQESEAFIEIFDEIASS
ncbi:hypothetical protein HDU76_006574 [Blyttiomyces sp. JEL0837]|nr:hypothetical protein HDU76_006574 [Blyttiomyces sp. JEL0837]